MKLYYAPGVCSLAPHIAAREAGIDLALEKVDLRKSPHRLSDGSDFTAINPKGYVPALQLDTGELLTEGVAILQYLAHRAPQAQLMPAFGSDDYFRLQQWLTFISSELHKMFSPWLFHPEHGAQAAQVARDKLAERFTLLDRHLESRAFLVGDRFTIADAYCFTIVAWSRLTRIDLAPWPHLVAYMERIGVRPSVRAAMQAEGLKIAA